MAVRLKIAEASYSLARDEGGSWREFARLDGGASALLPRAVGHQAQDADIEIAIEQAENWLMPHARALAGEVLEVQDATGRLIAGIGGPASWTPQQVEDAFNRVVELRAGPGREPLFVAHLVLVRELVHHGRLARVDLRPLLS